jgi:hypothetical protein
MANGLPFNKRRNFQSVYALADEIQKGNKDPFNMNKQDDGSNDLRVNRKPEPTIEMPSLTGGQGQMRERENIFTDGPPPPQKKYYSKSQLLQPEVVKRDEDLDPELPEHYEKRQRRIQRIALGNALGKGLMGIFGGALAATGHDVPLDTSDAGARLVDQLGRMDRNVTEELMRMQQQELANMAANIDYQNRANVAGFNAEVNMQRDDERRNFQLQRDLAQRDYERELSEMSFEQKKKLMDKANEQDRANIQYKLNLSKQQEDGLDPDILPYYQLQVQNLESQLAQIPFEERDELNPKYKAVVTELERLRDMGELNPRDPNDAAFSKEAKTFKRVVDEYEQAYAAITSRKQPYLNQSQGNDLVRKLAPYFGEERATQVVKPLVDPKSFSENTGQSGKNLDTGKTQTQGHDPYRRTYDLMDDAGHDLREALIRAFTKEGETVDHKKIDRIEKEIIKSNEEKLNQFKNQLMQNMGVQGTDRGPAQGSGTSLNLF